MNFEEVSKTLVSRIQEHTEVLGYAGIYRNTYILFFSHVYVEHFVTFIDNSSASYDRGFIRYIGPYTVNALEGDIITLDQPTSLFLLEK